MHSRRRFSRSAFAHVLDVTWHKTPEEKSPVKQTLSIPEWHDMAREGNVIPMRIPIHGGSMFPLVRMDRDFVTIMPLQERPRVGDIVLFVDSDRGKYVLHRVWKAEENRVLTWGDNCDRPDGWMSWDAVWGKAVLIERGKREIHPEAVRGLRMAGIWHRVGKLYRFGKRCVLGIKRRLKRLVKWGTGNG